MALKNNNDLTPFAKRLIQLMGKYSPRDLAGKLLDANLVTVTFRGDINNPTDLENKNSNAKGAVEKKIQRHIKRGNPAEVQGEFIIAYSKFFNVSADYILMKTDIKTPDTDIRHMCEITGLSEEAINRLSYHGGDRYDWEWNSNCWSKLITSNVYDSINKMMSTQNELLWRTEAEAYIDVLQNEMNSREGEDLEIMKEDLENHKYKYSWCDAAIVGSIYLVARNVSNVIEDYYVSPAINLKQECIEEAKLEIKQKYT